MFLPTTKDEMKKLGWDHCDVIFVSGDTYIDTYFDGCAVLGKYLIKHGFKVGIISQPDLNSDDDIKRLGIPSLFWGVSGGAMDSMVANYTALGLKRKEDDLTPGGINNRRPDRAVMRYVNLIQRSFQDKKPVVIGGIEASLRRFAHYDFHTDKIRGSILADSKADILVYGMGERAVLEIAKKLKAKETLDDIQGTCRMSKDVPKGFIELLPFEECANSKDSFLQMSKLFFEACRKQTGVMQKQGERFVVQYPPSISLTSKELDEIHELEFVREVHPFYAESGTVKAIETIRNSVLTHRGCFGNCAFCSISAHQGTTIISRSEDSILREIEKLVSKPGFNGVISDIGGPTANMYGFDSVKDHSKQISLLRKLRKINGIKHIFISSGIRHDFIVTDKKYGMEYLKEIVENHISGQMKIAPEHTVASVTRLMKKPDGEMLVKFKKMFDQTVAKSGRPLFLTYYFIAAYPGCSEKEQVELKKFISKYLKINPRQVQIFTPTPSTEATMLYWTEKESFGIPLFVEKSFKGKKRQKEIVVSRRRV
ncbi:MAG TPA: YgiQ family radical SAM protein [bacterium]|nr:YgiQ family radical SAM protein [bacterium]